MKVAKAQVSCYAFRMRKDRTKPPIKRKPNWKTVLNKWQIPDGTARLLALIILSRMDSEGWAKIDLKGFRRIFGLKGNRTIKKGLLQLKAYDHLKIEDSNEKRFKLYRLIY
jgi:hypothetical protein